MKKLFILSLILVISSCCLINKFRSIEHTCSLKEDVCENNLNMLKTGIDTYKADGGAFIIQDMKSSHIVEIASVGYNIDNQYHPNFSKIRINEDITPEHLIKKYSSMLNENKKLKQELRNNVKQGTAKNANIDGIDVYGITATTDKGFAKEVVTTFLGHFEDKNRKYAAIVILDNPKPLKSTYGFRTAGWNAVKIAKNILITINTSKTAE